MFKKITIQLIIVSIALFQNLLSQNLQDIQKMKSEYEEFQKSIKEIDSQNFNFSDEDIFDKPSKRIYSRYFNKEKFDTLKTTKHYGYNFFTQRDTLSIFGNLPAPMDYLLGPGDELLISLWGETQLRNKYIISKEGTIFDEKVGMLSLVGMNLSDANSFLEKEYSKIFSTLKKPKPSTYINVSLGKLRSINVSFVGNVKYPGIHSLHPFSDAITGLIQAGGIDTIGTLRSVQLSRQQKIIAEIDFYQYLQKGSMPKNIQLRDKDILIVPFRNSTVILDSAIAMPGIYESKEGETIKDLIDFAGGLKVKASPLISIQRVIPIGERIIEDESQENFYINIEDASEIIAQNGDIILPLNNFTSESRVEIIGQVKRPGIYHYYDGMKLIDLINLGGGINDSTFVKSIYMKSAQIVRRNSNSNFEELISIDLRNINDANGPGQIKLSNLDRLVIRPNSNFYKKQNVIITGEVLIPGSYPLISDKETLKSLILRAGGLSKNALFDGISIFRNKKILGNKGNLNDKIDQDAVAADDEKLDDQWIRVAWQNEKIILMPGDSINILRATGSVHVTGEVYNPGLIEFQKGKSLNYYIDTAGGANNFGNKNNVIVIYANGLVKPKKRFSSPSIRDGSTIIVNKKEVSSNVDIFRFATNTLSIISTTVTILALSNQIGSN